MAMLISRAGHGRLSLSYMQRVRDIVVKEMDIEEMSDDERRRLLQEETIVVEFEPQRAKRSLPRLLRTTTDRRIARRMLDNIEGNFTLDGRQRDLVLELRGLLPVGSLSPPPSPRRGEGDSKRMPSPRSRGEGARRAGKGRPRGG
jgi:hypothetical protein